MTNLMLSPRTGSRTRKRTPESGARGWVLVLKIALMAAVDALGIFLMMSFAGTGNPVVAGTVLIALVAINIVYFRSGNLAAKYIVPGLVFVLVFQVFVIGYTAYVSLTNYGSGHNIDQAAAITAIEANSVTRVPDSAAYPVSVVQRDGELFLLATAADGTALLGSAESLLAPAPDAEFKAGRAVAVPGYATLKFADLLKRQQEVTELQVPLGPSVADGYLKTADGTNAYVFKASLAYSPATDSMVNAITGVEYVDNGHGSFESADGDTLIPGWKANVGFENYATALGVGGQAEIIGVFIWTFAFAILSTLLSFAAGVALALLFNHPRMAGRRVYRVVMILPYAFPLFLSGLVWSGLLNQDYGFINEVIFRGAQIPWLQDPWLTRATVILVSVWFGAPYFFLVCTGALQAIPEDVQQAAQVDGVSPWQLFRFIKLPLLLVSVSPLLIAAFAFSFNDFNTIFMLSGGGPPDPTSPIGAGSTDILITVVYKIAFLDHFKMYGLASAFAVVIFLIVTVISIILFRRTKALENVY